MITSRNILQHEIIGLDAEITESRDLGLVGLSGRILDETQRTVSIFHESRRIVVPKNVAVFQLVLPNGEIVQVHGEMLLGRPEDRVKSRMERYR